MGVGRLRRFEDDMGLRELGYEDGRWTGIGSGSCQMMVFDGNSSTRFSVVIRMREVQCFGVLNCTAATAVFYLFVINFTPGQDFHS